MTLLEVVGSLFILAAGMGVFGWAWSSTLESLQKSETEIAVSTCLDAVGEDFEAQGQLGQQAPNFSVNGMSCNVQWTSTEEAGTQWEVVTAQIGQCREAIWLRQK